jgi:glycosyltransferase involved in cell wall biosynthesis
MPAPLVSIVVPNYNYAKFLPRSLTSALGQDSAHGEVIVVDDASTDNSREVIGRFGASIRPVLRPQNRGQGAGMNAGFATAKGAFVIP